MPQPHTDSVPDRRSQILDAALVCFAKRGFHQTSMHDISAEAGISVGLIYRYFENKEAVISAMADRLSYNSKTGKAVQGRGELVDALNDKTLKLDEIDQKQLPTELQKLDRNELQKRIAKTRDERADLQKQIVEVSKKREAYIQSENKRLAAEGKGDAFDQKVTETLHAQAAKKGITY